MALGWMTKPAVPGCRSIPQQPGLTVGSAC